MDLSLDTGVGIAVIVALVLFGLMQYRAVRKFKQVQGQDAPDIHRETGVRLQDGKHLLYFFRSSCHACKAMTPVVDELHKEGKPVVKINTDMFFHLAREFSIMGTPSLILVDNGKITKVEIGAKSRKVMENMLEPV